MKLHRALSCAAIAALLWVGFAHAEAPVRPAFPPAKTGDVVDDYHGTKVADPYRWLEDGASAETAAFVDAQNGLFRKFVDGSTRERIKAQVLDVWNYPKISPPNHRGKSWAFTKNDGLQQQSVLYVADSLGGEPRVLIDPNRLSDDGTVALSGNWFTRDGTRLAYGVSTGGSDQKEIRFLEVATGNNLPDVMKWCKFSSVAWLPDNSGFFYSRYPTPGTVDKRDQANFNKLYFHKLGAPQEQDALVYERPDDKTLSFGPGVTDDGQYLLVSISRGSIPKNRLYYRGLGANGEFVKLLDAEDARYSFIENIDDVFYVHTDRGAPRGRVVAIDLKNPAPDNWTDVLPESKDQIISRVRMINRQLVVSYTIDATDRLKIVNLDGSTAREIALPTVGSLGAMTGHKDDTEMFFSFNSPTYPPTTFRYDLSRGELSVLEKSTVKFDPSKYETKLAFAASKDGTRVPLFITHRRGIKLDGSNPTILGGYGGFGSRQSPRFDVSRIAWLEQGGVDVTAVLRGGGEFGEEWHRAGMLANKQNVFNDFIAAAEFLCKEGYTNPRRLAIQGGSNGGLLVAACMLQRPQLFGAVVCKVPVTDMLRYHLYTVGRFWIPEYGNANASAEDFRFLHAYSPLHNVKEGVTYPPILVTTGDRDDRVDPAHPRKFVATLQAKSGGTNPIFLRTQSRTGHGGGKPTSLVIDELADTYAFLARVFDMTWTDSDNRADAR
jgi:prolyl oligopeptidase